ncbi:M91 family zinc metallopeptidase [Aquimarina aggregata]|uniref:M91 family zinc metallopeptidase n=1 Tax=Aquimarina aggregata TaxID=1642818 RepID=UPI0024933924|nr:M91 family zinc metallopeptidase [Aquimarina aggregata]
MKKYTLIILFSFFFSMAFAQNPFEEFNYQPKIGTLSKGKYIEHFDNDSIVRIGSILFNTYTDQINGFVVTDTIYSEATLDPTIMSRWMNPDPLSDEFPDKSPYNFVNNNPIRYIDPLGLAPFDIIIEGDQAFRDEAFANLQALTDSQLAIDKNGKVTIVESGCNSGCDEGQNLVDGLISSDKVVTIQESDTGNSTTIAKTDIEAARTPGEGANSTIGFNPNDTDGGEDVNGNTKRPSEIGLVHELFHAREIASGTDNAHQTTTDYILPYGDDPSNSGGLNSYLNLHDNEVKVRRNENKVRRNRNVPQRVFKRRKDYKRYGKF